MTARVHANASTLAIVVLLVATAACDDERATPPRAVLTAAELDPWPDLPEVLRLRHLLAERRFGELDSAYVALAANADTSFAAECRLSLALGAFATNDAGVTTRLRNWAAAASDPRPARVATCRPTGWRWIWPRSLETHTR